MPSNLPRIAAYIDIELEQQLKAFCKEQGFSTSEAIAYILKHFFGMLPSELPISPLSRSQVDALTKRLEAVEQAISELQSEPPGQLRQESCKLAGKLPSTIPEEREPTGELLSEPPNHELTDERPSEQPVLMPNPFPEKGRSAAELAKLTGVTVEQIDQIHLLGDLENWKGGWRAVKKNGEYRYYPLGQLIKSEKSSKK